MFKCFSFFKRQAKDEHPLVSEDVFDQEYEGFEEDLEEYDEEKDLWM
ncbi:hypothetical protein JOD43_002434 [Pullulanibacillus pueri]|uniref:Uncharacterized protein n=1 Tax=Pullulanibacillus pueri TaxID=1437324 RepID=A0A8J2ZVX1_9BACL|nr:hypothetical protein [Pullulanibacillus pueri]MBM7682259.1 hypothetical protein [Pullulanibacillus pueri]GGH81054.1 hypothetical protein GCM10007096_18380 [Pullulanibacillus pueri]